MRIAIDLHIHSVLSPCAGSDMTPNNIVNMSILKQLDAIAITDHNSCNNVEAVMKLADKRLIVLPGMEVQTREEVHVLCYFPTLDKLQDFDKVISNNLPHISNVAEIFGYQYIMNECDEIVGTREQMLLSSVDLSINSLVDEVRSRGGVAVPAHIHRPSYSIISQLGFIPIDLGFGMLEVSQDEINLASGYLQMPCFYSSDAHRLEEILERESYLNIKELTIEAILDTLRGGVNSCKEER